MENGVARHLTLVPAPEAQGWGDFPVEVLPEWARVWCEQLAHELQVSRDLPVLTLFGTVAGCVGGAVQVYRNPQWVESSTLWTAVVYGSGEHKSAAFKRFVAPIDEFERRQDESYLERLAQWMATCMQMEEEMNQLGAFLRELRKNASKVRAQILLEQDETKRKELEEQLGRITEEQEKTLAQLKVLKARYRTERNDEPIPRRLQVNDVTPIGLIKFLARNRGRGLVLTSEASFLDNISRYGLQALPTLLSAESGDTLTYDRGNAPPIVVRNPSVSVAVMPQPHVVEGLARQRGARERGLLARFLVVYAVSFVAR
jgi:replicative DNA helicase